MKLESKYQYLDVTVARAHAGGFGVVSVAVGYTFVVDVFVKGFGEVDHWLLLEEAALTMHGEAVGIQFRMVVEDEGLDHGPRARINPPYPKE